MYIYLLYCNKSNNNSICFQGRTLNYKTFFMWVLISIYQGKYTHRCQCRYIL